MKLDDRIYCLQKTGELPEELRQKVHNADVLYLQDQDKVAEQVINEVEAECSIRGIQIYKP